MSPSSTHLEVRLGFLGGPLVQDHVLTRAPSFAPARQRNARHQVAVGEALGGGGAGADGGRRGSGDRRSGADRWHDLRHRGTSLQEVCLDQLGEGGDHLVVLYAATL